MSRDLWRQCGKYSVLVPARNGSNSFHSVSSAKSLLGLTRILACRHPVDRFTSLWRFCQQGLITSKTNALLPIQNLSPDEMMSYIQENPDLDRHWLPQVTYWSLGVTPVLFNRLYEYLGLVPIHSHKSAYRLPDEVPEARINMHYAEDVALYKLAKKSPRTNRPRA